MDKNQFFFLFLFSFLFFFGCKTVDYSEKIPGKWIMSEVSAAEMSEAEKDSYEYLRGKVIYEFSREGKFKLFMKGRVQDEGIFELKKDRLLLKGGDPQKTYPEYRIKDLEENKLTLESKDESGKWVTVVYVAG